MLKDFQCTWCNGKPVFNWPSKRNGYKQFWQCDRYPARIPEYVHKVTAKCPKFEAKEVIVID